jgi:hypothetical protein
MHGVVCSTIAGQGSLLRQPSIEWTPIHVTARLETSRLYHYGARNTALRQLKMVVKPSQVVGPLLAETATS